MIDLHLHTERSHDATGTIGEYCERAIEKGLKAIAITDHLELDPGFEPLDFAELATAATRARAIYGDRLKILLGAEVSYRREMEDAIAEACDGLSLDFLIGSVHAIGSNEFVITEENGARRWFGDKFEPVDAYAPYFDEVFAAVKFGYFDVLGHFDVVKRYGGSIVGPLRPGDYYGALRRIIEGMVKRGMALEVNTSGLRRHGREMYPSPEILKLYRELGGDAITLSSDAHRPAELAADFEAVMETLKSLGFESLTYFEAHEPARMPLA